jgi:hypothetical protein
MYLEPNSVRIPILLKLNDFLYLTIISPFTILHSFVKMMNIFLVSPKTFKHIDLKTLVDYRCVPKLTCGRHKGSSMNDVTAPRGGGVKDFVTLVLKP